MSSMTRENMRAIGDNYCTRIVRRMVSLPRSIIGGVSRAMGHGLDFMRTGGGTRRNNHHHQHLTSNFPFPYPQNDQPLPPVVAEEWAFLANFEQQFGSTHPFFYACRFMEALKMTEDDRKFMFMYLHSPEHPYTPSFCKDTLCSELVVQFLDANFISWGGLASSGEGLQMAASLRPASFPLCAVVARASGDSIAVLQQIEGPISPAELVEILQRTVEEQGLAFGSTARAKEEERIRADRRLREEQDAAYLAALQTDKERGQKNLHSEERVLQKPVEASNINEKLIRHNPTKQQYGKVKEATQPNEISSRGKDPQATQILIRFPNGERREQNFSSTEKVQALYQYIDSLGLPGIGNYRLISSFPRRVYGVEQMGMTLKDAGLHPKATLFLELL